MRVLEDSCLTISRGAESIFYNKSLNSAGSEAILVSPKVETIGMGTTVAFGYAGLKPHFSSIEHSHFNIWKVISLEDSTHELRLTQMSMEMSQKSFDELWSKEDDAYWDSY
ncbi:hypothetical protein [Ekhidna sp.]|uniref:hypothetical protein n=1 Tax=Ekhidna sp. TaxID=2608089 RepID=UPI0032F0918D